MFQKRKLFGRQKKRDRKNLRVKGKTSIMIGETVKDFIYVKIKSRQDDYADQMSRIIVTKLLVVAGAIMGIKWFNDETTCIPPSTESVELLPKEFLHRACWVKGLFVYPYLTNYMDKSAYYGIPINLKMDGHYDKDLCETKSNIGNELTCMPMDKQYFTQYQWMPFYVVSLAFLFHSPYIAFRLVNTDMTSLKFNLKNKKITSEDIVLTYFNRKVNSATRNRVRVIFNYIIKLCYIANHFITFGVLDRLLNFKFMSYGKDWVHWAWQNSTMQDFRKRSTPTPGNSLFPSFGLCELYNIGKEITRVRHDEVLVVCEISTHILYQYAFVVIWCLLVLSCVISFTGLIYLTGTHVYLIFYMRTNSAEKKIYKYLTIRECEYVDFIRRRDMVIYKGVLNSLKESIDDESTVPLTYTGTKIEENQFKKERPPMRHMNSILDSDLMNE